MADDSPFGFSREDINNIQEALTKLAKAVREWINTIAKSECLAQIKKYFQKGFQQQAGAKRNRLFKERARITKHAPFRIINIIDKRKQIRMFRHEHRPP